MSRGAYLASEDSALLRGALNAYSGERCLEIGAGNGGSLLGLADGFGQIVGTDIIRPTMMDWKESGVEYLLADAATCLRDSSFDLVVFNPPYLAGEVADDRAVEGGTSLEVPLLFLREALRVVKRTGRILMLLRGGTEAAEFIDECSQSGFVLRLVAKRHLFYEELVVYEAVRSGGSIADLESSLAPGSDRRPYSGHTEMSVTRRLHQVPASPS